MVNAGFGSYGNGATGATLIGLKDGYQTTIGSVKFGNNRKVG
jgi:hypothetical protein